MIRTKTRQVANTSTVAGATLDDALATVAAIAGGLAPEDRAKLDSVQTGATANSTDSALRARSSHTGTQAASTISDLANTTRAVTAAQLVAGANVAIMAVGDTLVVSAAGSGGGGGLDPADRAKLDGIQAGATANSPDAQLRDRSTHTGTQLASTVSDFAAAVRSTTAAQLVAGANTTITQVGDTLVLASAAGPGSSVISVAGKTGAVTLGKADVGLPNVDDTSDADKPVSTAQANALAGKEASITAGTNSQFWRGDKTWTDFATTVRAAVMTGLSTATSTAVAAADTLLVAVGKLQAQVSLRALIASPSFTGTATFQGVKETVTPANTGTAYTVANTTASILDLTLTDNCVLTYPAPFGGLQFTLFLKQDATGSRTVTWPSSVRWAGGTAPTLTTTAGRTDVVAFLSDGTYWLGFVGGLNFTRA